MRKYKLISALAEETAKEVVRNEENWRRSDSQLMDSRDVDSTEENENAKEDMLQNSGKKVMTFQ